MQYKVLVIDDDEPIHYLVKNLLGKEFKLEHARNAQEAIDILAKTKINLILSDVHMPGLTGLELLQSLRADREKRHIPVLIMTSLPTVEKEKRAMELGASDFINKELFNTNKYKILELVRMKLVTNIVIDELSDSLEESKNKLVMSIMNTALLGLFSDTVNVLCSELLALLDARMLGFWLIKDGGSRLLTLKGDLDNKDKVFNDILSEPGFAELNENRIPKFTNHIYSEDNAFFKERSINENLPAEIVIPLYSVTEVGLLNNELFVPDDATLFATLVIKRDSLISRTEFELVSKLVTQTGSILWRLYKNSR